MFYECSFLFVLVLSSLQNVLMPLRIFMPVFLLSRRFLPRAAHQVVVFYFCSVRAKAFFRSPAILDCQTLFKNESRKGWLEAVVLAEGTGDPDLAVGWPSRQLRRESSDARSLSLSSWVVQVPQRRF